MASSSSEEAPAEPPSGVATTVGAPLGRARMAGGDAAAVGSASALGTLLGLVRLGRAWEEGSAGVALDRRGAVGAGLEITATAAAREGTGGEFGDPLPLEAHPATAHRARTEKIRKAGRTREASRPAGRRDRGVVMDGIGASFPEPRRRTWPAFSEANGVTQIILPPGQGVNGPRKARRTHRCLESLLGPANGDLEDSCATIVRAFCAPRALPWDSRERPPKGEPAGRRVSADDPGTGPRARRDLDLKSFARLRCAVAGPR